MDPGQVWRFDSGERLGVTVFAAKDGVQVLVRFASSCGASVAMIAMNMCFIMIYLRDTMKQRGH